MLHYLLSRDLAMNHSNFSHTVKVYKKKDRQITVQITEFCSVEKKGTKKQIQMK